MASLSEIREGIAVRLNTIPGLQASAKILSNPTLPVAYVLPGQIDFHKAMGNGHSDYNIVIELQVGTMSDQSAQDNLDALLSESGEQSVKAAIEAEDTLGGLVDQATVQGTAGDYGFFANPQGPVLGERLLVYVMASGN